MASIYQVRGNWYIKYVLDGKRLTDPLRTKDRNEAQLAKARLEVALLERKLGLAGGAAPPPVLLTDLIAQYRAWLPTYHKDGRRAVIEGVLDNLDRAYGAVPIKDFGPKKLAEFRETMVEAGLKRKTCNDRTQIVKAMFRWGIEREIVEWPVYNAIKELKGLAKGRTQAGEYEERLGVSRDHIQKAMAEMPRTLQMLVLVQYLTGARPGELLNLTPADIDRTEDIWVVRIKEHKNAWREGDPVRYVCLGERAKKHLAERVLSCRPDEPLFSPRRAMQERNAERETHRHQPVGQARTDRRVGDTYTTDSYRRAVKYACEAAGIPVWTPHQLRHQAASEIEKAFGAQAARAALGHASLDTTSIYLHQDLETMKQIAAKRG